MQHTDKAFARLAVSAARTTLRADSTDLVFDTVRLEDAVGRLEFRANHRVSFIVTGPAELVATDNGDATRLESFQASACAAFNGIVLAVVRFRSGQAGPVTVRAAADGLLSAELTVSVAGDSR